MLIGPVLVALVLPCIDKDFEGDEKTEDKVFVLTSLFFLFPPQSNLEQKIGDGGGEGCTRNINGKSYIYRIFFDG